MFYAAAFPIALAFLLLLIHLVSGDDSSSHPSSSASASTSCTTSENCSSILGSLCDSGICTCKLGYVIDLNSSNSTCRALVCSKTNDCRIEGQSSDIFICKMGTCGCKEPEFQLDEQGVGCRSTTGQSSIQAKWTSEPELTPTSTRNFNLFNMPPLAIGVVAVIITGLLILCIVAFHCACSVSRHTTTIQSRRSRKSSFRSSKRLTCKSIAKK